MLYSSRLTTRRLEGLAQRLRYSDFSNASVLIEIQDAVHVGDPLSHFEGQLDQTGKFFGVLNYDPPCPPNFDLLESREKEEFGSRVYQGRVRAIASERQDRMQIIAMD